ncbi:hypothetical protein C8R45DRAFT_935997 [Mycena sanguinolenta]|nr:hypothetical protein C8R45DRAFT_935997 [Mycena sanguinolenta]
MELCSTLHAFALSIGLAAAQAWHFSRDGECVLGEKSMVIVERNIPPNPTEKEIKFAVKTVCDEIPGSLRQECDDFLSPYGDEILALLLEDLKPADICTELRVC